MKQIILITGILACLSLTGCSQSASTKNSKQKITSSKVGGNCEECKAIYESPVPFEKISSIDTLPDYNERGPKIEISGIVYQSDGRTPAKDVILYIYHTDQAGYYNARGVTTGWGKQHGYIRGWIKTDKNGFYQFYTLRPASYPEHNAPQHIHAIVKEPDKNEYWIDSYLFDDDPLLTNEKRKSLHNLGGNGIVQLTPAKGFLHATRHIILGRNVPGYPVSSMDNDTKSGLALGSNCPAFDPLHLSGADKDKHACPMCKYGFGQGVMVWFNHANLDQMNEFALLLENEMQIKGEKNFRAFLVYMNPFYDQNDKTGEKILQGKIKKWCETQNLQKVAVLWVPSPVDIKTCGIYKINPEAKNTVFVYKKRKVAGKWVNMNYDRASFEALISKLNL